MAAGLAALLPAAPGVAAPPGQPADGDPVALEVLVMDGTTGGPLRGARVAFARHGWRPVAMEPTGDIHRLAATGLERGRWASHDLNVSLPAGWCLEDSMGRDDGGGEAIVTRLTRTLCRTVVAWPDARVRVRVVDAAGAPVEGATLSAERTRQGRRRRIVTPYSVHTNGRSWHYFGAGKTDARGEALLRGVPAIPGVSYRVTAYEGMRSADGDPFTVADSRGSIELAIALPEPRSDGLGWSGISGGAVG